MGCEMVEIENTFGRHGLNEVPPHSTFSFKVETLDCVYILVGMSQYQFQKRQTRREMIDGVVEQDPKVNVDECRSSVFVQVEGLALGGNVKEEESMATDCG